MKPNYKIKAPNYFYRLLFPLWFIFWLVHAFLHALKYKQWAYIPQRLGIIPNPLKNSIWVHAASVGEVNLIKPLCEQLIAQGHSITLTTFTATGLQRANNLFNNQAQIFAIPMDCWPISWLFSKRLKAKCALIAETELWPETLYQVAAMQTPLIQINARLSKKSLTAPKIIKILLKQTLSYFTVHLTRYEEDVHNFLSMGAHKDKVQVMGNLKHAQSHSIKSYPNIIQHPYILFASTHDNEEQQLTSALFNHAIDLPLIVIAPRHPKRLNSIIKTLIANGFDKQFIALRSQNQSISANTKIYLADTLGEMNSLYQHASIVIMGGSFIDIGGHNVIEPAALGACIITGPSDSNIKQDIADLKLHNGIIQVKDIKQLITEIKTLSHTKEQRTALGKNAARFVQKSQHVLTDYLTKIESIIKANELHKK